MSELNISVVIMRENMLISGEIYTTGKNFTLPPAVTNITSDLRNTLFLSFGVFSVFFLNIDIEFLLFNSILHEVLIFLIQ